MMPPNLESVEFRLLAAVDAAFEEARHKAGNWLVCHSGCDECCRRPFAITQADAARLQRGLALSPPEIQQDIRRRAADARTHLAPDFPGHLASATLTPETEWRDWFFTRHTGLPCPVLDLATGSCRLYHHRPIACRLAGPLIQIGSTRTDTCHRCFATATPEQINSTLIEISEPEFAATEPSPETLIAFSL